MTNLYRDEADILTVLQNAIGGRTSYDLASSTGMQAASARRVIQQLRKKGFVIPSTQTGYILQKPGINA